MKKNSIIIILLLVVVILAIAGVYLIDIDRMKNNKPVFFSTWGHKYAPPEILGEIIEIVDKTKTEDIPCDTTLEKFYEDEENEYYFSCIKSQHIIVKYENGYEENIKFAFEKGNISLKDLYKFNIDYHIQFKNKEEKSLKDLPLEYSTNNAIEDGCFVITHSKTYNTEKMNRFITNVIERNISDKIRIVQYTIEGDLIIRELSYNKEKGEYTILSDNRRDEFANEKDRKIALTTYLSENYILVQEEENDYYYIKLIPHPLVHFEEENPDISICIYKKNSTLKDFEIDIVLSNNDIAKMNRILNTSEIGENEDSFDIYYYGIDNVNITVKLGNNKKTLEESLKLKDITIEDFLIKIQEDVRNGNSKMDTLNDGGTNIYTYDNFKIIKCNKLDGNKNMYIGIKDMSMLTIEGEK